MKVEELLNLLEGVNPELEIILSKDGEGNSFSKLYDITFGNFQDISSWEVEFSMADHEAHNLLSEEKSNSICLWPIN